MSRSTNGNLVDAFDAYVPHKDGICFGGNPGPGAVDFEPRVAAVVTECPTPFFLYSLDHVRARARFLKNTLNAAFGTGVSVHYAVKANANRDLLQALHSEGVLCDVVSGGEIECCLDAGFKRSDILFSGVAKTASEIRLALDGGVKQINVESLAELRRIEKLALAHASGAPSANHEISIGLRFNPNVSPETHPYITTGLRENKFGLEEDGILEAVELLRATKAPLRLRGLSLHIGSQLMDLTALDEAIGLTLQLQCKIAKQTGWALDRLDVGGGLGIDYATHDETREREVVSQYADLLKRHLGTAMSAGEIRDLMIEPGRWLVARSGVLITEVQYLKSNRHKSFVIVDGGMNLLIRPALYEAEHRIWPLAKPSHEHKVVDVVGPICESADFLGREVSLPMVKEGDRLAVFDAGAYGRSMTSNYNQRGWPDEYVYENGALRLSPAHD